MSPRDPSVIAPSTPETLACLTAFAAAHGRTWKRTLRAQWSSATASPELMALRNTRGPSWLAGYQLPAVSL